MTFQEFTASKKSVDDLATALPLVYDITGVPGLIYGDGYFIERIDGQYVVDLGMDGYLKSEDLDAAERKLYAYFVDDQHWQA